MPRSFKPKELGELGTVFRLEVNCDTDAFADSDLYPQLSQILSTVAAALMNGNLTVHDNPEISLRDINGNTVGKAEFNTE